jgi:hypothetical protein
MKLGYKSKTKIWVSDVFLIFADFIASEFESRKVLKAMTSYDAHEKDETMK